jgi:hypothetical protein
MKLEHLFFGDPFSVSVYAERYVNDKKGIFCEYSDVHPRYDPQGEIPVVLLPYTVLPPERCVVYKLLPSQDLLDWVHCDGGYKFFWHPDVVRDGLNIAGYIHAQPTSSTRTLLTNKPFKVYVKTNLNKKHFRFIRRLKRSSVEHSLAINSDLHQFAENRLNSFRYSFFPESLGIVVLAGEYEGSGTLYREASPPTVVEHGREQIPFHALYAPDQYAPEDEPLLVQLVRLNGGSHPSGISLKRS